MGCQNHLMLPIAYGSILVSNPGGTLCLDGAPKTT